MGTIQEQMAVARQIKSPERVSVLAGVRQPERREAAHVYDMRRGVDEQQIIQKWLESQAFINVSE